MSESALALAGVFQASELVRQAANHGTWSGFAADASLDSLFQLEAVNAEEVFGGKDRIHLGLETMMSVLGGESQCAESLQLVVGLLQLQAKFMRSKDMQRLVGERLEQIANDGQALEPHERKDLQAREIAELYTSTISTLTPRIVVQGRPQYLQNPRTVSWIRTLLFAGLRSAVLWRQLGGGRFNLLFGRKKVIDEANRILRG